MLSRDTDRNVSNTCEISCHQVISYHIKYTSQNNLLISNYVVGNTWSAMTYRQILIVISDGVIWTTRLIQGSTYPTAWWPGASKIASQASGFGWGFFFCLFFFKSYIVCIKKCKILEVRQVKIYWYVKPYHMKSLVSPETWKKTCVTLQSLL